MENLPREIIVLFSPTETEPSSFLLRLAGLFPDPPIALSSSMVVSLCTRQMVFPGHLTAYETLKLMASLWGIKNNQRVRALFNTLEPSSKRTSLSQLPTSTLRLLHWLTALLPDPDVVLVDDLAVGLSPSAKRQLWQRMQASQEDRPRTIFYATRDLEAVRSLGDQVWLIENGQVQACYQPETLPETLRTTTGFALTLKTARAAEQFCNQASTLSFVKTSRLSSANTVEVWVQEAKNLLDLTWSAGFDLIGFESLPQPGDASFWLDAMKPDDKQPPSVFLNADNANIRPPSLPAHPLQAVFSLALNEWRGHFRSFWKAGNLLLTSIYLLTALSGCIQMFNTPGDFLRLAPLFLLFSATLSFGFALESINRLGSAGEETTLFQPAQPVSATRPLSRLALYDLTPTRRGTVLTGIGLGQFLLLGIHNWPMLIFIWGVQLSFQQALFFLGVSFVFWALTAFVSFSGAVWVGARLSRPGWGTPLGWLGWFLAIVSGYGLASLGQPLTWLWPFAGFTAAFQRLAHPEQALLPLFLSLLGTGVIVWGAWRAFLKRPALWKENTL